MKRIGITATWTLRRAGGIYIGAWLHFPVRIFYDDKQARDTVRLSIGLAAVTIRIEVRSRPIANPCNSVTQ